MNKDILKSIFFRSSTQKRVIPAWPFLQPPAPGTFTSQDLDNKMQTLLHSDAAWDFIREVGEKRHVGVQLAGASAGRLAYRSSLILRRESGEERISPYATGTSFDDIVPLYSSLLTLSVAGGGEEVKNFSKDVHAGLSGLVELEVLSADTYKPEARGGDPISKMVLPLDQPHAPPEVVSALQSGVLGGQLADEKDKMAGLHTLEALALFDLSPTPELKQQLARVGRDVSSLDAQQGEALVYTNKLFKGLFMEAADKENFYKLLNDMNKPFSMRNFSIEYDTSNFLVNLPNKAPLPTKSDGQPSLLQKMTGQAKSQGFDDHLDFELVNHVTRDYDSYRNMTLNPYGKINGYISRRGASNETAGYGNGFYAMGSWDKYWSYPYTVYAVENPNLKSKIVKDGKELGTIALLNDAAEAYVVMPEVVVDPYSFVDLENRVIRSRGFNNSERRQFIAISFNKDFKDLRSSILAGPLRTLKARISTYEEPQTAVEPRDAFHQAPSDAATETKDNGSESDQGAGNGDKVATEDPGTAADSRDAAPNGTAEGSTTADGKGGDAARAKLGGR